MEIFIFHCSLIELCEMKLFQAMCSAFVYIPNPTMRLHLLYQPILHVNVCIEGLVVINYFTTFDQKTIALQQKKHNTRHNYSVGELTVCSVTPEMKEEGGKSNNLCIIHQHTSKHQSAAALSTAKIKFFISSARPFITDDQKKIKIRMRKEVCCLLLPEAATITCSSSTK